MGEESAGALTTAGLDSYAATRKARIASTTKGEDIMRYFYPVSELI